MGTIEEYPLEELIYPPFKNDRSKHEHGIKCLLRLSKAKADPKAFHHLVGDKAAFDRVMATDAQKTNDLVELAGRVKRALQSAARNRSADAETEEAAAAADRDAMNGLVDGPCDAAVLQAAHTEAVQRHAMLRDAVGCILERPGGG